MPARQPFTALCQALAPASPAGRADLHVHTTHSDGQCAPGQVMDLAARSGLAAVDVTDHDTVSGLAAARAGARPGLEVIAGVEITAAFREAEVHVLGYFFRPEDAALKAALERLRAHRAGRFGEMVERLGRAGVRLDARELPAPAGGTLGRRHLAELLVKAGRAQTVQEAFRRYLHDGGRAAVPKLRLSAAEAIALVRGAGGVAAWAHPPYDGVSECLEGLRRLGLQALEVAFPACRPGREKQLRALAAAFGLAVTGGSDCHGPGHYRWAVGGRGVTGAELENLRRLASR